MSTSVKEISWVAGILEGEGSFGLSNSGRTPIIQVGMTDFDVIERLRNIVDRSQNILIHADKRKESYKTIYRFHVNGNKAAEWMMTIFSLMSIRRRAKIKGCLEIWKQNGIEKRYQTESFKNKTHTTLTKATISLVYRLRNKNYPESAVEMARVLLAAGLNDIEIVNKLIELGFIDLESQIKD